MMTSNPDVRIQRQIVLPISKAIEIAYKSIRLRLSRSLLVTSGIVLALAFLMSVLCSDAMIISMRAWSQSTGADSKHFSQLRARRDELVTALAPLELQLMHAAEQAGDPSTQLTKFYAVSTFGKDFTALKEELGALPAGATELSAALAQHPEHVETFRHWLASSRELSRIKEQLTAPQRVQAMMKANGIPTTAQDIASSKTQTRWIIGLALLVAFVGILNAMLMSVTERFSEIGTMKCLGALDSFIIKLFLIESLFQGVVGTIIGVILGFAASAFSMWSTYGDYAWIGFPALAVLRAGIVCLLIGMGLTVAGAVYPAWQAARMQPIDAMRVET